MKNKFEKEKEDLVSFSKLAGFKIKNASSPISDPPDISIELNGQIIGVEHSLLYKEEGEKLKANSKEQLKIVARAEQLFKKQNKEKLKVSVRFNSKLDTRKGKSESLANNLLNIVIENSKAGTNFPIIIKDPPPPFKEVIIGKREKPWATLNNFFSKGLDLKLIQDKIDVKNIRIPKWSIPVNQKWLLLIIENERHSDFFSIDIETDLINKKDFDKVILFSKGESTYKMF
jgi:hypothetical protein|tara:strand:- start:124 stop:813 length:690 start_codon:yes stop_codon:yes gene_type:complete